MQKILNLLSDLMQNQEKPEGTDKDKEKVEDNEKGSDDSDQEDELFIPSSHEVSMHHGNKAVTALNVDPSGARLASGISINELFCR